MVERRVEKKKSYKTYKKDPAQIQVIKGSVQRKCSTIQNH